MPIPRTTLACADASKMRYSLRARLDSKILSDHLRPRSPRIRAITEEAAAIKPHRPARILVWKSGACEGGPSAGPTSLMRPASARIVESVAAKPAWGPPRPTQLASTWVKPQWRARIAPISMGGQFAESTSRPSIKTSQSSISAVSRAIVPASAGSRIVLKLRNANHALWPLGVSGAVRRIRSPPGCSIF